MCRVVTAHQTSCEDGTPWSLQQVAELTALAEQAAALGAALQATVQVNMPPAPLPQEPTQTAAREVLEEALIEQGHFHFSWHIPDVRHPDVPCLDVLATLLGSGRSSRLFRQVRETLGLTDRAYIVYAGEILTEGTPDEIVNNPDVRRLYLGEEFRL